MAAKCITVKQGDSVRMYRLPESKLVVLPEFRHTTKSRYRRAQKMEARLKRWQEIGER